MELENHPIPQDVSHFQFKLIGSMSVKQLGYIGAGFIFAWIFYALPIFFLIKIPLVLFYPIVGITLAFIPIEGRPADLMVYYFIKALFEANQYVFLKGSTNSLLSSLSQHTLIHQNNLSVPQAAKQPESVTMQTVLTTDTKHIETELKKPEVILPEEKVMIPTHTTQPVEEKPQEDSHHEATSSPEKIPQVDIQKIENKEEEISEEAIANLNTTVTKETGGPTHEQVAKLQEQLETARIEREKLEKELHQLKQSNTTPITPKKLIVPIQPVAKPQVQQTNLPIANSLPMPEIPNLITGSIKDSRGNILPNILIEIKDKEGNPVRAFKTNQLGQFASATPLLNGVYTINFEDTQNNHKFDTIEMTVNGQIIPPIEITSVDEREQLRKSLFG